MPRFFFHLHDAEGGRDEAGLDLADAAAARAEAIRGARGIACEQLARGRLDLSQRIDIEDEFGRHVATVTFGDAVALAG